MTEATAPHPGTRAQTRQAAAIEDVLREADGFRTAQELHDELRHRGDSVGLTTVYRHLNLLAEHDLADVVHRDDGESQYRLCGARRRVDARTGTTTTSSAGSAGAASRSPGPRSRRGPSGSPGRRLHADQPHRRAVRALRRSLLSHPPVIKSASGTGSGT